MNGAVFLVISNDALAHSVFHDKIGSKEFDEILGVVTQRLAIESVKKSMPVSISSSTSSIGLSSFAKFLRLATERTLVAV
jgi:hypothetical protein